MLDNSSPQISFTCRVANCSSRSWLPKLFCQLASEATFLCPLLHVQNPRTGWAQLTDAVGHPMTCRMAMTPTRLPLASYPLAAAPVLDSTPQHMGIESLVPWGRSWHDSNPRPMSMTQVWVGQAFMFLEPSLALPSGSTCFPLSIDQEASLIISVHTCSGLKGTKWPETIWKHK